MKKLNQTLLIAMMTLSVNAAMADCLNENWVVLHKQLLSVDACQVGEKLALTEGYSSYPLMHLNPYRVEYWQGSYQRTLTSAVTSLHEIVDYCSRPTRVVFSEQVTENKKTSVDFVIDNPNLHDDVTATYELLPMTDSEAQSALDQALKACQSYAP